MKKVILKSLTLRNFKGEKERTTVFGPIETTIMGDNGLGKTRHFDAFIWLLFGKDSQDRKDFCLKTLIDGVALEKIDVEVSAIIDLDGTEISLRRIYKEKWVKPRGQTEEILKGHETETYYNDVHMNVGEYQSKIGAIVDDYVFKMITNPLFFANMKWQDQREQLFQLAGTISDEEIAATDIDYKNLIDRLSGKTLIEYRKEIAATKKKLKADLSEIKPKIQQTQRLMPDVNIDFDAMDHELKIIDAKIDLTEQAISDKTAGIRAQYEHIQQIQRQIGELNQQRQKILFDKKTEARENAYKANSGWRDVQYQVKSLQDEIATLGNQNKRLMQEVEAAGKDSNAKDNQLSDLRQEWYKINEMTYQGDCKCNACGQELPDDLKNKALSIYENDKTERLNKINEKGANKIGRAHV